MKRFSTLLITLAATLFFAAAAGAQQVEDCLVCHGDPDLKKVNDAGEEVSLCVDKEIYKGTAHGEFTCVDCHADLFGAEGGHDIPVQPVNCSTCHGDVAEIYSNSIHGQLLTLGDTDVPDCASCHGHHDIYSPKDERSSVNKFNLMYTCAKCHQNTGLQIKRGFARPDALPQFYESVHAKGLIRDGLIVAPSCNDCHGTHDIQNASNPRSPIHRRNVYHTCGKCHTKVEEVYTKSIHGQLVEGGDSRGPVCSNCHESHAIISPEEMAYKQYSDERCGHCHQAQLTRYQETFHGKAMRLGATNVAACYDCHGNHDIVRSTDPASPIYPTNRVATCKKCHENANAGFAGYITHANHFDKEKYPQLYWTFILMTALLVGVFLFFGFHTLLWIVRSVALYLRDSKTFREAKIKVLKDELIYTRFTPLQRMLHILLIISFTTLVVTGIPLKFFYAAWALTLMKVVGGVQIAGYLHRIAAVILVGVFVIHAVNLLRGFIPRLRQIKDPDTGKFSLGAFLAYLFRPDSMIPSWRDVRDFWNHQKWFFGLGEKPRFERWTYWEKFDYFAVFWGVVIIGFSGLIMWFPTMFTAFLPGWIINVAHIIHSDEALLAAGFIFTFHFFNVHFRIEKFPMDTVVFSGKISKAELLEERRGWYDRMTEKGQLEQLRSGDEWESWRPIAKTFGFLAFGTGIILAVAIFWAMLFRLIFP
ncbi:MAG TPA: hypothetical protein VJ417_15340 [Candidatus Glassbacteria bacterium]|nr:hypothetical protein [Candidatus Glassbacteria bacterium]